MGGKVELDITCDAESLLNKKPYNRPEVKVFGGIKRLTQGQAGSCPDQGDSTRRSDQSPPNCGGG